MHFANYMPKTNLQGAVAVTAGLLLIASSPVLAHHPMGSMTPETMGQGLLSGLGHPVIGLDHLAFLVVAFLLASLLKGASRFVVPLAFIGATVAGTVLFLGATTVPMVETLVALTVVVGGVLALMRRNIGALVLGALFAVSGVFHGYAYGEAIIGAETTPLLAYLAGFAVIQYALIVGGVLGMAKLASRSESVRLISARIGSSVAVLTGAVFVALSFA